TRGTVPYDNESAIVRLQDLVPQHPLAGRVSAPQRPVRVKIGNIYQPKPLASESFHQRRVLFGEARLPRLPIDDLVDVRLERLLQTAEAGLERRVQRTAVNGHAEPSRGQQGVLLGVHADANVIALARGVGRWIGAAVAAAVLAVDHL